MKEQSRTNVTYIRKSNFRPKMKRLQTPQKLMYEHITYMKKFYVHEIAAVNLSNICFLKNAKKSF